MKLKRSLACVMTGTALAAAAVAAPAMATEEQPSGSLTVPLGSTGGCYKYVTVYWDTTKTPPVGTAGRITC